MTAVLCAGVICADVVVTPFAGAPGPGGIAFPDQIGLVGGGSAHNTAVALAALGVRAAARGRVGDDLFGEAVRRSLRAAGVDADGLAVDARRPTSATVVLVPPAGERSFLHCPGPPWSASDLGDLDGFGWLHVAGAGVLPGLEASALARALRAARERGLGTSLDTALGPEPVMRVLGQALRDVDVCFANLDEGRRLTGRADPGEVAAEMARLGAGLGCVKLGAEGALAAGMRVAAPSVAAVDSTGAGDAFVAGFLAARFRGWPLARTLATAAAAGAECVRHIGATTWCADAAAVRRVLAAGEG